MKLSSLISTVAIFAVSISLAQAGAYMKIEGIDGESAHPGGGEGWIIIESLSAPMQRTSSGSTTLGDVVIMKELDKASPKLMESLCTGGTIPDVTISLTRVLSTGEEKEYYRMTLTNVHLKGNTISLGGATSSSDQIPRENFSLNYIQVEWTYFVISASGQVTETITRSCSNTAG